MQKLRQIYPLSYTFYFFFRAFMWNWLEVGCFKTYPAPLEQGFLPCNLPTISQRVAQLYRPEPGPSFVPALPENIRWIECGPIRYVSLTFAVHPMPICASTLQEIVYLKPRFGHLTHGLDAV